MPFHRTIRAQENREKSLPPIFHIIATEKQLLYNNIVKWMAERSEWGGAKESSRETKIDRNENDFVRFHIRLMRDYTLYDSWQRTVSEREEKKSARQGMELDYS